MNTLTRLDERPPAFLAIDSVTSRLCQSIDWAKTPLGSLKTWPNSLKTTVGMMMRSRHPMFLWWGPELIQIYNDAYLPSFGEGKHPRAMGQRGADCWQESWAVIWPQIDDVMRRGQASWNEDQLVPMLRNGQMEEVYWTYGYSPIIAESGEVGGTLVVCTETTAQVLSQRRLRTVRTLFEKTALAMDWPEMLHGAASVFREAPGDIPFALIITVLLGSGEVQIKDAVGLRQTQAAKLLDGWIKGELSAAFAGAAAAAPQPLALSESVPCGCWPEPVTHVLLVPLGPPAEGTSSFILYGLSPRLPYSSDYLAHLGELARLLAEQVRVRRAIQKAHEENSHLLLELRTANRAKDEFLAMLSHELRNPLAPIVTALQLIKLRRDDPSLPEYQIIERQVEHLSRLVNDLLDVSRLMRGKIRLKKEYVEVAEVLGKSIEVAKFLLEERHHRLSVQAARGMRVEGDPARLTQIVANLLKNAARFTEMSGRIELSAVRDGNELVISVKDNGIGISEEMLPRIFEPFIQGKQNTDRAEGGLGLGLTLVKSLVSLHGGTVTANSAGMGCGSEFIVRLAARPNRPLPHRKRKRRRKSRVKRANECCWWTITPTRWSFLARH